ncbi:MAG: RNA methyltransferase [Ignavibacteriae bacterium]|nr:RNA methyltransferase [Ignavibacteriota bacterium]
MKKLSHAEILSNRLTPEIALANKRHPVTLVLDNIRSLYNVGSIFRTADAALVSEIILCGYTPAPPRMEIEKTALGAVDTVPWQYQSSAISAILELRQKGVKVFAVEITDSSRSYGNLTTDDYPIALVLGNELVGIDTEVLAICEGALEIPMYGVKHSLNVSVATGIVVFEAVKIWKNMKRK